MDGFHTAVGKQLVTWKVQNCKLRQGVEKQAIKLKGKSYKPALEKVG